MQSADLIAIGQHDLLPGVCCAAAVVCTPDGRPVAALSALTLSETVPPGVANLLRRAGREIRNLTDPLGPVH